MLVVLGSDLIRQTGEGVPEFRALAVADNLLAHATSIPGSLRMGTPPAPPKRRDAAPAAPDDTQIIPIWIARPAPAPNQDRLQNGGSACGYQAPFVPSTALASPGYDGRPVVYLYIEGYSGGCVEVQGYHG